MFMVWANFPFPCSICIPTPKILKKYNYHLYWMPLFEWHDNYFCFSFYLLSM